MYSMLSNLGLSGKSKAIEKEKWHGCQNFRKRTRKTEDRELAWQVVFCVKM